MKRKTLATVGDILGMLVEDRPGKCLALDRRAGLGGAVRSDRTVALQPRGVLGQKRLEKLMNAQTISHGILKTRNLMYLLLIALLLTACASLSPTSPAPTPLAAGLSDMVNGKVDVGGYALYYTCAGEGSPTVIL